MTERLRSLDDLVAGPTPGQLPGLPRQVRPPALQPAADRLVAAYRTVPVLQQLHQALPQIHVEAASVNIADHLDGDYWHAHRLIRVECQHPSDVIAYTLLHEFGHAVDHHVLDDATRRDLLDHLGLRTWRGTSEPWERRGEEWYADAFARVWWPPTSRPTPIEWRIEARTPTDADLPLFDLRALGLRRPWWRRVLSGR